MNMELDENGFTPEQSARITKNIEDMKNGKGITMTLEEFDAWFNENILKEEI
ncbi:MAG: hypothetical protein LBM41_06035 [Ruminococcus sp.]|jgi:hypothetical protein|nr:hypothetical protein [Ruminococcus sp.]